MTTKTVTIDCKEYGLAPEVVLTLVDDILAQLGVEHAYDETSPDDVVRFAEINVPNQEELDDLRADAESHRKDHSI